VSAFREADRARRLPTLRCPKCPAENRPGATYIDIDETGERAYCSVCAVSGPIEAFEPKESPL